MEEYNCNWSKFDLDKHLKTYINYLEVMISPEGEVDYAHPSHQEFAIEKACEKLGLSREELIKKALTELDWLNWLLTQTGYIAVWTEFYQTGENGMTKLQRIALQELKERGAYIGEI